MSASSNKESLTDKELFPIRTVSSITGVNSITLRAWERRYGLVQPVRTPKGHRMYTQENIDMIQRIMELLDKGISIGQVKNKLNNQGEVEEKIQADPWSVYQRRMVNAVVRFDTNILEQTYNEALSLYPVDLVISKLIVPLLKILGKRWETTEGSIAEEHFFGTYLRNKIGARFHHQKYSQTGPILVAACIPHEYHEVGLLLFCLSALSHDYQLVILGANTPLEELIIPVTRINADGILLSGSIAPVDDSFYEKLEALVNDAQVPVFFGGNIAVSHHDKILSAGAIPIGVDIRQALTKIDGIIKIDE